MNGPEDMRTLRVRQFAVGQVWLVSSPARVARVEAVTVIDMPTKDSLPVAVPALRMKVTLPCFEVAGHITPRQVEENTRLRQAIIDSCKDIDGDDSEWEEVWSERMVHPVVVSAKSGAPWVDDGRMRVPQLYVHAVTGKNGPRQRTTERGQKIEATLLDPAILPDAIFRSDAAPEKAAPPADGLPTHYLGLKALADKLSVDIADCRGSGANARIRERLKAAMAKTNATPEPAEEPANV